MVAIRWSCPNFRHAYTTGVDIGLRIGLNFRPPDSSIVHRVGRGRISRRRGGINSAGNGQENGQENASLRHHGGGQVAIRMFSGLVKGC